MKSASPDMSIPAVPPVPILGGFTADPAIRVFGDTYYCYPTSDKPNWNTTEFAVWSSKNLVEWKIEGVILDVTKDLQWADLQAWAPDCIERDGTYYFYFCARGKIGVATASSPLGPFKDALGRPLLQKDGPTVATAHHSVLNIPGTDRWYVAYHRHAIPGGSGYKRETCLARMEFNADGSIKPMDPMTTPFQAGDAGEPLCNGKGNLTAP